MKAAWIEPVEGARVGQRVTTRLRTREAVAFRRGRYFVFGPGLAQIPSSVKGRVITFRPFEPGSHKVMVYGWLDGKFRRIERAIKVRRGR